MKRKKEVEGEIIEMEGGKRRKLEGKMMVGRRKQNSLKGKRKRERS